MGGRRFNIGRVGAVGGQQDMARARQRGQSVLGGFAIGVIVAADTEAVRGQAPGDGASDAARCAGDKGGFRCCHGWEWRAARA